jgi:hypothetical protein
MMCPPLACTLISLALLSTKLLAQDTAARISADNEERRTSGADGEPPAARPAVSTSVVEESDNAHRAKVRLLIRDAIRETFPYDPAAPKENTGSALAGEPSPQANSDPNIIVLDNYNVRSRAFERDLPLAIQRWRPSGPQNKTKFGTGIRQKDFGKVRASMVTILYIPVLVGFSW